MIKKFILAILFTLVLSGGASAAIENELKSKIEKLGYSPISKSLIGDDLDYSEVLNRQIEFIEITEKKILNELKSIETSCIEDFSDIKNNQNKLDDCVLRRWEVNKNGAEIDYLAREINFDFRNIESQLPKTKIKNNNSGSTLMTSSFDGISSTTNYLVYGMDLGAYKDQNSEVNELMNKYSNVKDGKRKLNYAEITKTTVAIATAYVVGKYVGEKLGESKTKNKTETRKTKVCTVNRNCPFGVCSVFCH